MPIIPLLPSDSAALVEYKIYLAGEVDSALDNIAAVQKWRRYYDGLHDLLLSADQQAFLGSIISAAGGPASNRNNASILSTDWPIDNKARRVVDRVRARLNVQGLTDESDAEVLFADQPSANDALSSALRWWKTSDLDLWEGELYKHALRDAEGYLLVDHDGRAPRFTVIPRYDGTSGIRVRYEDEAHTTPLYATKFWRTADPTSTEASNVERCTVYTAVEVRKYIRPANDRQYKAYAARIVGPSEDGWYPIQDPGDPAWPIPWVDRAGAPLGIAVVPFVSPRGSLVQSAIGLNNALNKTNLDLLAAADQLGFGVFAIEYEGSLPESTNAAGAEIDPADDGLGVRPGRVFETTGTVKKLPGDDLQGLLAYKADLTASIAANCDVPIHEVIPLTGQVPSGAALRMLESSLTSQVEECQARFGAAWRRAFSLAQNLAQLWGGLEGEPRTLYPVWKSASVRDPDDEAAAQTQEAQRIKTLTEAGLPLASALRTVGWDEEKIAAALSEKREQEASAQASMAEALLRQARAMERQQPDGTVDLLTEEE